MRRMRESGMPYHVAQALPVRRLASSVLAAPLVAAACVAPWAPLPITVWWALLAAILAGALGLALRFGLRPIRTAFAHEQRKLTALLDSTPEGVLEVAADGTILFVNEQLCRSFGYDREELLGRSLEILVPVGMRAGHAKIRGGFLASARSRPMGSGLEIRGVRKDGVEIPLDISLTYIDAPRAPVTYCLVRDVSATKAYERKLVDANRELIASVATLERNALELRRLAEMGELLHSSVTEAELFGIVAHAMQQLFPQLSGAVYVLRDPRGRTAESAVAWGDALAALRPVMAREDCWALRRSRVHEAVEDADEPRCRHCCDERRRPTRCVPLLGHGELLGVMHLCFDGGNSAEELTDGGRAQIIQAVANQVALSVANLRLRETLRDQSLLDPLTGLYNRRAIHEWFEREITSAVRNGRALSVLLVDIDHFKRFNDQCGHECGDTALRHLAGLLRDGLRADDLICRLGGEEFAILLPDTAMREAIAVAEKLRRAAEALVIHHRGQAIGPLTISIGVAALGLDADRAEQLLRHADRALYRAKAAGRNCVQASDELDRTGVHRRLPEPVPVRA